jgi:acetoin utilization deacetylase AcuC-like enzyme
MLQQIPVFYDERQSVTTQSFSPSASKPAQVVLDWKRNGLPIRLMDVRPADPRSFELAHSRDYVNGIMGGTIANGFGNTSDVVAESFKWTVGSMMTAASWALDQHKRLPSEPFVACSPTSGFHHAHYDRNHGFCTFNGLVITALHLIATARAKRVGILDFDYHYGDGTDNIIKRLKLGNRIKHYTAGAEWRNQDKAEYAVRFAGLMAKKMSNCDIILYQAGADQHIDDPLGGLLTTEQMRRRDRAVFWCAKTYNTPLVWNLAGGYQRDHTGGIEPVLALHRQTMQQCIDIYINEGALNEPT